MIGGPMFDKLAGDPDNYPTGPNWPVPPNINSGNETPFPDMGSGTSSNIPLINPLLDQANSQQSGEVPGGTPDNLAKSPQQPSPYKPSGVWNASEAFANRPPSQQPSGSVKSDSDTSNPFQGNGKLAGLFGNALLQSNPELASMIGQYTPSGLMSQGVNSLFGGTTNLDSLASAPWTGAVPAAASDAAIGAADAGGFATGLGADAAATGVASAGAGDLADLLFF